MIINKRCDRCLAWVDNLRSAAVTNDENGRRSAMEGNGGGFPPRGIRGAIPAAWLQLEIFADILLD